MRRRFALAFCVVVALAAATAAPALAQSEFTAKGSAEQVYATGLAANAKVSLDRKGKVVATAKANDLGGVLFRKVKPGRGYRVSAGGQKSGSLTVLTNKSAPPNESVYDQEIEPSGYQYLETRDGTELAITVHPATDVAQAFGGDVPPVEGNAPRPTLIEYSGYGTADPDGPESGISLLANIMGFTVVDVSMRGTGCSGGAFDFFEPLQNLDGYDVIETIARQPWVAHGKVGMLGISYGGISQLFTAATQPPSLAAITPVSVLDQTQTTLYPGGILNTGFALAWAQDRVDDGQPAGPDSGQPWAWEQIEAGDTTCEANQVMHGEAANLLRKIKNNDTYRPKVADPLSPITFVDKINVPVFMACQWQDEQTGGHCPTLASRLTGTDKKWVTFTNGTHIDSLAPETFNRLYDFLKLYVAKQAPNTSSAAIQAAAPVIYGEAMGVDGVTLPPDPVQQAPTYEAALAAFEAQPPIRIDFDNGAGEEPGQPYPGYSRTFERFPIPGTEGRTWNLSGDGALTEGGGSGAADEFTWNPGARPPTNFTGNTGGGDNGLWTATPPYNWLQPPEGSAASYVSEPLAEDTTVAGAGFVEAWVRSSKPNVDLQATITEVRPDGKEVFVQGGWVRTEMRKLDAKKSTPLEPVLSLREKDVKAMPKGKFAKVTIPLYYQGHPYREGSQIRVIISAPNGDQPVWAFAETDPKGTAKVAIAHDKKHPSNLTLPVLADSAIPTELPPCPGIRGEPCRDFQP